MPSLPVLTRVSSYPSSSFDRILFAHMFSEMKYRGSICRSQRDYGEIFNRIDSARFSRSRRLLERDGWVHRSSMSVGDKSDCYEQGKRFDGEPYLLRSWSSLAHNLWGRDGLLTNWSQSAGWGHGCLGVSGMLVLATVERADCLLSRKQIFDYLETFCSYATVRRLVKRLADNGIFVDRVDGVCMSENWCQRFEEFVASSPAGTERLEKGNDRRQKERVARRRIVERGLLTDAERVQLQNLGCWVSDCSSKGKEPDHFPPNRFLSSFEDTLSPHILFAACRKHNRRSANFIASLPDIEPERRQFVFDSSVDPMRLFRASNNLGLVKFNQHAEDKNLAGAISVIKRSLDFFYTLQIAGLTKESRLAPSVDDSRPRRRKGSAVVNRKSTFESQI